MIHSLETDADLRNGLKIFLMNSFMRIARAKCLYRDELKRGPRVVQIGGETLASLQLLQAGKGQILSLIHKGLGPLLGAYWATNNQGGVNLPAVLFIVLSSLLKRNILLEQFTYCVHESVLIK